MTEWVEKEIPIAQIDVLLSNGYEIEVDSPDGWVGVNGFVNKGMWREYRLEIGGLEDVRCNANHKFQTKDGWKTASELIGKKTQFLTRFGYLEGVVRETDNQIAIVDINVNHENHRYYTEDVSSHNTGTGKSLALCHMAAVNLMDQKNVLYITLEMAEERIAQRIDANLLNVPIGDLPNLSKAEYNKKLEKLRVTTKGKLIVKEYPTATAGPAHFRHLLNELKIKKNFVPDVIYIDYLNLCISSRIKAGAQVNSYTYVKAIAEELRGLAVEFDLPIWTATQTNRSALNNSDIGLEHTSDSMGLPMTLDFYIALNSPPELQEMGQLLVSQLKSRYGDPSYYKNFVIGVDRTKMRLYNVENSAQDIDEKPVMDSTTFGEAEKDRNKKFDKGKFSGFK